MKTVEGWAWSMRWWAWRCWSDGCTSPCRLPMMRVTDRSSTYRRLPFCCTGIVWGAACAVISMLICWMVFGQVCGIAKCVWFTVRKASSWSIGLIIQCILQLSTINRVAYPLKHITEGRRSKWWVTRMVRMTYEWAGEKKGQDKALWKVLMSGCLVCERGMFDAEYVWVLKLVTMVWVEELALWVLVSHFHWDDRITATHDQNN